MNKTTFCCAVVLLSPLWAQAQSITDVQPATGSTQGAFTLTVSGNGFGGGATLKQVLVGGRLCPVSSATGVEILCDMPSGEGAALLIEVIEDGSTVLASAASAFSYTAPSIEGISSASMDTIGAQPLTVMGQNFGLSPAVFIGGRSCPVTASGHQSVTCTVPAGQGASLAVTVTAGGQEGGGATFSYLPPAIGLIDPATLPTVGGVVITLNGSNFGLTPSARVGTGLCDVTYSDHGEIQCVVPPGQGTGVEATVFVAGQVDVDTVDYAAPAISSITPSSAATKGGTVLTLNGSNFGLSPKVTVGGVSCGDAVVSLDHDRIECSVPEGEGTSLDVSVAAADQSDSSTGAFSYDNPSINSVTPVGVSTAGADAITIHGQSFGTSPSVAVGGSDCEVTEADHDTIICTSPAGEGGAVSVVVTAGEQVSAASSLAYAAPSIEDIDPATGPRAGSTPLTIRGENFGVAPSVTVGGAPCDVMNSDSVEVVCSLPAGGGLQQPVVVTVSGQPSLPGAFSYEAVVCDEGEFSPDGDACLQCSMGTYQDQTGQTECIPCAPGSFVDSKGAQACILCSAGRAQPQGSQSSCYTCPPGTASSQGATECIPCAPGTYQDLPGEATCANCPVCEGCGDAICGPSTGVCPAECPACGDGSTDLGEECDDGNDAADDGCSDCAIDPGFTCLESDESPTTCMFTEECGDGFKIDAEGCDDGNLQDGDGCSALCVLESGWDCSVDATGAIALCEPVFGDGSVVGNERCDDGNEFADDGCSEGQIDDGWACTGTEPSRCTALVDCGDGDLDDAEECDDGNNVSGDGCADTCAEETGWTCDADTCEPLNDDGLVVGSEQCDDGNEASGDGCAEGLIETDFACDASQPSVCVPLEPELPVADGGCAASGAAAWWMMLCLGLVRFRRRGSPKGGISDVSE